MHLKCVLMSKTNALLINESFDPLTTKIFLRYSEECKVFVFHDDFQSELFTS